MTNFSLEGKRALITGASGGIGGAVAEAFAEAGATIALSGRRADALEARIESLAGSGHKPLVFDLGAGEARAAGALIELAAAALDGGIDILVNNAGINRDGIFSRIKPDDWNQVLEVNLSAAFFLAQAALRPMARNREGRVISISSVVATMGNAGQTNYVASKAGLEGMTRSLAREVGARGVTVNCVAPGFVETAMTEKLPEAVRENFLRQIPAGRAGAPGDIAGACLFLASPAASWITGQTLHVNGGMLMN